MRIFTRTFQFMLLAALTIGVVLMAGLASIVATFPSDQEIRGCMITKMHEVDLCPKSHKYVSLDEVSPFLVKALVLTEDSAFWNHQGFDFEEMKLSLEKNIKSGKYKRGGSTITQQLAKNLFLTEEKTLTRKIKEAVITLRLEKVLSKKEILERYLNVVQFGKNIYGVRDAASFYFKKTPAELNLVESAFLTFLLPSPEKYSVSFSQGQLTNFAETRLKQILSKLYQYQRIDDGEYAAGLNELSVFLRSKDSKPETSLPTEDELDSEEEQDPNSI